MLSTLAEIRANVAFTVRESQINSRIDQYINLTVNQINNFHPWSFLRRKTTFNTVDSQESYQLPRDVDRIGLLRNTQQRLRQVPDHLFYKWVPNPTTETTYPRYYRLWEQVGVATQLSTDAEIDVVSDNADDTQSVTVEGLDSNGIFRRETYTLVGTTKQEGSITFSKILQVSKSAATTGIITVTEDDGDTTIVTLMPWERAPRFKTISLYPIPSTNDVVHYLEYFTRLKELVNDQDVPNLDTKWLFLIREGTLAKVYQYQNKENDYAVAIGIFRDGLKQMRKQDMLNIDYIPYLGAGKSRKQGLWSEDDDFASFV